MLDDLEACDDICSLEFFNCQFDRRLDHLKAFVPAGLRQVRLGLDRDDSLERGQSLHLLAEGAEPRANIH